MTHAYQEIYLSNAQALLGDAFDYAINACGVAGDSFIKLFSVSSVSNRIENGEPSYLLGKAGLKLLLMFSLRLRAKRRPPSLKRISAVPESIGSAGQSPTTNGSPEENSVIFLRFFRLKICSRCIPSLHEADVTKFADIVDAKVREYFADTNLKRIRTLYGCTQAELAKRSNVSLRSIQMYEQRNKDINKASAETVLSLAKVLGCTMEDLLET